jgi:hypothetical protein
MTDEQTIRTAIDAIIMLTGVDDEILDAAERTGLNPMELINRLANELKMRVQ